MGSYPRAIKPNYGLNSANALVADLGTPALAVANHYFASAAMHNGAYTLAETDPGDGTARNVTCTQTAADTEDTNGTLVVVGLDLQGRTITETLIPNAGSTVAGTKCFASITSITGVGWVIDGVEGTPDTITIGFGTLVGLPGAVLANPVVDDDAQVPLAWLDATALVPVVSVTGTSLAEKSIDASAGTYDGSKRLLALVIR